MRRKLLLSIGVIVLLLLMLPGQISYATPSPLYILVNESTRQCYVSIMNDECFFCKPPQGWRIFGTGDPGYGRTDCPAGYNKIDQLEMDCTRYKSRECCGGFSSIGNCDDMVVNATQQACAFVPDIKACTVLPQGWSARPAGTLAPSWICNFKYHWVENVTCLTGPPTPAPLFVDHVPNRSSDWIPMIGTGLILLGVMLVWFVRRRVHR
jgi:hypothetical protein